MRWSKRGEANKEWFYNALVFQSQFLSLDNVKNVWFLSSEQTFLESDYISDFKNIFHLLTLKCISGRISVENRSSRNSKNHIIGVLMFIKLISRDPFMSTPSVLGLLPIVSIIWIERFSKSP